MSVHRLILTRFGLLILGLLLVGGAAGCRAAPALPTPPHPAAGTPTSGPLNLTLWHSETGAARNELEALARDFHSAYPDVTVTPVYVGVPADLSRKVIAAIALGQAPDLILAPRRDIAEFVRQDGLTPLDALRADPSLGLSAEDEADLLPGVMDEGTFVEFDKQLYAFPFDLDGMVLFYNPDLLQASSFTHPPATWDEFSDMASKVTKDQQYGWAMNINADVLAAMLVSQGSAALDIPERRVLFGERGGLAALTMAAVLYKSGPAVLSNNRNDAIQDFAQGQAAFYIDWMSTLSTLDAAEKKANASFTIGVANLPQGDPTDPYMLESGTDLAITRMPPDRLKQAWFFIRWITGSRQAARWSSAANSIPLRASALPFLTGDAVKSARLQQIQTALQGTAPHLMPRSAHVRIASIEHLMEDAWNSALNPKADIPAILTNATTSGNAILAGNR